MSSPLERFAAKLEKKGISAGEKAPTAYLNTGFPPLNENITGDIELGLPNGRVVMIAGPSASGKTMIATQLMISAQKQGGYALFFDHELAYAEYLAVKQGLNADKSQYMYIEGVSFERSIKNCFEMAQIIRDEGLIPAEAPIVAVFDSLAAMVPEKKLEKDIDEMGMNDSTMLARSTSQIFPIIVQKCNQLNIQAVFLNQTRDSMSMYGPAVTTPGGKAPYFYSSTVIYLSGAPIWEGSGSSRKLIGKKVTAKIEKCKTRAPGKTCEWDFLFKDDGTGEFDVVGSYFDYLKAEGKIKSAGNRVEWNGKNLYPSQVKEELKIDPDALATLKAIHKAA